jgi:hypothetical protein
VIGPPNPTINNMDLEEIITSNFSNIKAKIHQIEALQYLTGILHPSKNPLEIYF